MKRRKLRTYRKGRIEIIPMIDVMFFLLATFMLASLAMQNLDSLKVDLPQGQAEKLKVDQPLTLTLTGDGRILVNKTPVTLGTLADTLRPLIRDAEQNVVVLRARAAGAVHFLIAVKHQ
ncbi:MAG: outer rane transport energization protein ExbD [Proteobacteria bacterium]|nr:outer rane transport energization protein ExbD [Pseudomonadota bacterium]